MAKYRQRHFRRYIGLRTTGRNEGEQNMNTVKILAILLLVGGTLGLVYGGFSYTKDTTAVKLGPLELSVKEQKQVNIPLWAGIGAIVAGGVLLLGASKRS
jgi:hypothetical protein